MRCILHIERSGKWRSQLERGGGTRAPSRERGRGMSRRGVVSDVRGRRPASGERRRRRTGGRAATAAKVRATSEEDQRSGRRKRGEDEDACAGDYRRRRRVGGEDGPCGVVCRSGARVEGRQLHVPGGRAGSRPHLSDTLRRCKGGGRSACVAQQSARQWDPRSDGAERGARHRRRSVVGGSHSSEQGTARHARSHQQLRLGARRITQRELTCPGHRCCACW
jgi:hypothetical protein